MSSFKWAILTKYTGASCSRANVTVASIVGLNVCYPTTADNRTSGNMRYVMATTNGTVATYRYYDDSVCTQLASTVAVSSFPVGSCQTRSRVGEMSTSSKLMLSVSAAFTFGHPGLIYNYFSTAAGCRGDDFSRLVASDYIRVSSAGCLAGPIDVSGTVASLSQTCSAGK